MTIRTLWLTFAQTATVALAAVFVVTTLKPEWLASRDATREAPVVVKQAAPAPAAGARPGSYNDAVVKAAPAVVNIFTSGTAKGQKHPFADDPLFRRFFGDSLGDGRRTASLGSGVIVSPKGYVITNNHVVEGMDQIEVLLADSQTRLSAKVVGTDLETDLAVLKVERDDLPAITFGALDAVRVGDVVLAIGNPFGVGQTVTMGIVSALGRTGLGISTYENFIQTDAAINQGNSGGALVDTAGNLVGINTAIYSRTGGSIGIGFAIPTTIVTGVMKELIGKGRVTRGYFGIEPVDITPELVTALKLGRDQGVVVRGVQRSAPAGSAGMEPGDVLLSINDTPVRDTPGMLTQIAQLAPGSVARVRIERNGRELELNVTVGERPVPPERR